MNDYSSEAVFFRQIDGVDSNADVAIRISTSGNSNSVIQALVEAKKRA